MDVPPIILEEILPGSGWGWGERVCDPMYVSDCQVDVPYVDLVNLLITSTQTTVSTVGDVNENRGSEDGQLQVLYQVAANDPRWLSVTDESRTLYGQVLYPGSNYLSAPWVRAVEVTITEVGPAINSWYPGCSFKKLGFVAFGGNGALLWDQPVKTVHWLNFVHQAFMAEPPLYAEPYGVNVYLLPGCYGYVDLHFGAFPGSLNIDGRSYPAFTGYPY